MEELIERTCGESSSHELAIHFLLRHAERRMALTIETDDQPRAAATAHPLDTDNKAHRATSEPVLVDVSAAVARSLPEDSFTARFSRAYAAARQIPASSRNRVQAHRMSA